MNAALRCQGAIGLGVSQFIRAKLAGAVFGKTYSRAHAAALGRLDRIERACAAATVVRAGDGTIVPAVGDACAAALGPPGSPVAVAPLRRCLEDGAAPLAERVARPWWRPNLVLILTDDQRWDTLDVMPNVQALLAAAGVDFANAFVTTSLCCPSRASILTGQYAHTHEVLTNVQPYGGVWALDDSSTLATWLHDAGYVTGIYGKYLNGYTAFAASGYVAPGWDEWHVFETPGFFDYALIENGTRVAYGSAEADYSTDVLAAKAVEFIHEAGDRPFFLWFGPYAPHEPATPAPRHAGTFADLPPWRPPNYDEPDVSDKPLWLRRLAPLTPELRDVTDAFRILQLESLLAVDEAVQALMEALRATGQDRNTLVLFTTDNGYVWGEHRWLGKQCPYDECMRVPFVVRYPLLVPSPRTEARFGLNVDVAPTFAELAGVEPPLATDGRSLVRLLADVEPVWREHVLGEHWGLFLPTFASVRSAAWKYVEYVTLEAELYDLAADPYELQNVIADPANAMVRFEMAVRLRQLHPAWPWLP
jgi:arylsulfatase A-like enzyme